MVYISEDGKVLQTEPWNLKKVFGIFTGLFYVVTMFFRTLFNSDTNKHGSDYTRDYRPGSGPPRPPTRRIGRPSNGDSVYVPFGCSTCGG